MPSMISLFKFQTSCPRLLRILQIEYLQITLILIGLLGIFFWNIIFFGSTLLTSTYVPGTMPDGPYGYTGPQVNKIPVIDAGVSAWLDLPSTVVAHKIYTSGKIPLWNPYLACGTPLAANMQSAAFFPLKIILYLSPAVYLWDFYLVLRLFFAGFFTYLFMRLIRIEKIGSLVSAIIFMFSSYLILFIDINHLNVAILIPFLLYSFERLVQHRNAESIILVAFAVGLSILGGMPELTFFALFFITLFYFYRSFFEARNAPDLLSFRGYVPHYFFALLLGFMLSALLFLPFIEYLKNAWHGHPIGTGLEHASFSTAISLLIPHLSTSHYEDFFYVGILPLFLACFAFQNKLKNLQFFFFSFAIFFLLKFWGFKVVNWVGYLPLFNISYFPQFCFPMFIFSVAALGGMGIENIYHNRAKFLHVLVILLIMGGLIATYLLVHPGTLIQHYRNVRIAIVAIVLVFLLSFLLKRRAVKMPQLTLFLVALLIVEQFIYLPKDRAQRCDPFTIPPYINFLRKDSQPFRILGLDKVLYPNTSSAYGIEDIRSLDALYIARFMTFVKELIHSKVEDERFHGKGFLDGFKEVDNEFLDLLNVKYILTATYLPSNKSISDGKFELVYDREIKIYRNKGAYPRVFIVHRAEVIRNEDEILARLKSDDFDLKRTIIIEEDIQTRIEALDDVPLIDNSIAEIINYKPNCVTIKARMENEGFLVLSDTYFPGWKVFVDSKKDRIYQTDYLIHSVYLPRGNHEVKFIYDPLSFKIGLSITFLAILFIVLFFAYKLVRRLHQGPKH